MKRLIYLLLALCVAFSVVACDPDPENPNNQEQPDNSDDGNNDGNGDDNGNGDNGNQDENKTATLLLIADTTYIASNGKDTVRFQVIHQVGEDQTEVTDQATIRMLPEQLLDTDWFASKEEGEFKFQAFYNNLESNLVLVLSTIPEVHNPEWTFQVGEYYRVGDHEGVVFHVDEDGKSGMIVSLDEAFLPWSTVYEQVGAFFMKGEYNFECICAMPNWEQNYPAAKWCADHGEGWFLPCYEEIDILWSAYNGGKETLNPDAHAVFEQYFTDQVELGSHYWTSTEISEDMAITYAFIINDVTCTTPTKTSNFCVRAIRKF